VIDAMGAYLCDGHQASCPPLGLPRAPLSLGCIKLSAAEKKPALPLLLSNPIYFIRFFFIWLALKAGGHRRRNRSFLGQCDDANAATLSRAPWGLAALLLT
jgi:hypothetical protein